MRHKKTRWAKHLSERYGITIETYETMLQSQGGVCASCGGLGKGIRRLHVDHDHRTEEVRGLLCANCNVIIGHAHDSIHQLKACIEYLSKHSVKIPLIAIQS